jgi:hypothetical protein
MKHPTKIQQALAYVGVALILLSNGEGAFAAACYEYVESYTPTWPVGKQIAVVCGFQASEDRCKLDAGSSSCRDVQEYDPALPDSRNRCINYSWNTGFKCTFTSRSSTQRFYSGTPWCTRATGSPPSCETGCGDWDTESSTTTYTWEEVDADYYEECAGL